MTRGKYAAKANGQRAEAAANTVVALRGRLDQERREHAAEVAKLKAQIDQLNGRLVSEVRNLADDRVQEAERAAAARVEAEQVEWKNRAMSAMRILERRGIGLPAGIWAELWATLELTPPEALGDRVSKLSREKRRTTVASFRRSAGVMHDPTALVLDADAAWREA